MKKNGTLTLLFAFLVAVTSLLMTSCSGVRYTYFDKKKVPYTASEEIKLAKTIPVKPFLNKSESELKEKTASTPGNSSKQEATPDNNKKKSSTPAKLQQIFNEKNIAKYNPLQNKNILSEKNTHEDRELMIVILIVLILIVIALLGDNLIWLLFLALLIFLIYILVKYLGIFN